jgi:hypothetical protein
VLAARIARAVSEQGVKRLHIDLVVVTHIDCDHIGGILELLQRSSVPVDIGEIWFNGSPQLTSLLGVSQGEALSDFLERSSIAWNKAFCGRAIAVEADGALPFRDRLDGLRLTLLGPIRPRLGALWEKWQAVVASEGRDLAHPAREHLLGDEWPPRWDNAEKSDSSVPNGSSIALLLEYSGRRLLLAGDAYASDLADAIDRLPRNARSGGKLRLDAFKLSHHGSASNLSRDLLERLACRSYIISTDGSVHHHPDSLTLLRILRYSRIRPCLMFNYETAATARWRDRRQDILDQLPDAYYDTAYPERPDQGILVEWSDDSPEP